jgi:hypothetical protein
MDILDRLIYTSSNTITDGAHIMNPVFDLTTNYPNIYTNIPGVFTTNPNIPSVTGTGNYFYHRTIRQQFTTIEDTQFIESAMQKHWFDVAEKRQYTPYDVPFTIPPYHLMYAYLLENTRIAQIFEKVMFMYLHDEKLTKASDDISFQWIINLENLFFKDLPNNATRSISGYLRPVPEASRRNAYQRLLGVDLAFGDIQNNRAKYQKAEFANNSFILLFESFLREVWQAYTNARNTSGQNTTDYFHITDTAEKIQQMLMSRRYMRNDFSKYKFYNLSREEYGSVLFMSWLFEVISYNSPFVEYLRCTGNTPGERLINIGNKVGIPAHSKSEAIFEMAPPLAALLRLIENGAFNPNQLATVTLIIQALVPGSGATPEQVQMLNSILLAINNWELVTGHNIKGFDATIKGGVKLVSPSSSGVKLVSSNGVKMG